MGVLAVLEIYSMVIATNLTFICYVYKEKSVKKQLIPKNVASIQIQKYTTRIVENQFNLEQIIQILLPIIIDHFLTHS